MSCLELAHRNGHWVILNNIHLMPSWLIELEKKLDEFALEGSHEKFRLYLSSDPSNAIPIGVLSRCIKLTNEPPAGLKANLKRAFANFSREYIEEVNEKMPYSKCGNRLSPDGACSHGVEDGRKLVATIVQNVSRYIPRRCD